LLPGLGKHSIQDLLIVAPDNDFMSKGGKLYEANDYMTTKEK
jgi:hypothetical protein